MPHISRTETLEAATSLPSQRPLAGCLHGNYLIEQSIIFWTHKITWNCKSSRAKRRQKRGEHEILQYRGGPRVQATWPLRTNLKDVLPNLVTAMMRAKWQLSSTGVCSLRGVVQSLSKMWAFKKKTSCTYQRYCNIRENIKIAPLAALPDTGS